MKGTGAAASLLTKIEDDIKMSLFSPDGLVCRHTCSLELCNKRQQQVGSSRYSLQTEPTTNRGMFQPLYLLDQLHPSHSGTVCNENQISENLEFMI